MLNVDIICIVDISGVNVHLWKAGRQGRPRVSPIGILVLTGFTTPSSVNDWNVLTLYLPTDVKLFNNNTDPPWSM